MRTAPLVCVMLVTFACRTSAPAVLSGASPQTATDSRARLVVQPMTLVPDQILNPAVAPLLVLSASGVITAGDLIVGRFAGDRVTSERDEVLFELERDNTVRVRGAGGALRLHENGEVEAHEGTRLSVAADGAVTFISPTGERAPGPVRVTGVTESTRATAAALVLIEMQRRRGTAGQPGLGTPALQPPAP
jgi:hypothetical protein